MNTDMIKLLHEFKRIKEMGWVMEKSKGFKSVGYTFEKLLGKKEDDFPLPDFGNIEIKTMNTHSTKNIHLFNLTPDGDFLYPIKRILNSLGCKCKENNNIKKLYCSFNGKDFTKLIYGRKGILNINWEKEKIDLLIYDYKNQNISIGISWSFDLLKERINMKLKNLAFIRASSRIIDGNGYYYYNSIKFYRMKNFDTFLLLIKNGVISITFKIGYYKTGRRMGEIYDHGTDFSINANDITALYDEIKY